MNLARTLLIATVVAALVGCTNQNHPAASTTRPLTSGSDRKQMKEDNQAAMVAMSHDHQAVTMPTTATTQRSAEEILSSLKVAVATIAPSKLATTQPIDNNVNGSVTFTQVGSMLIVVVDLAGLQPNSSHAVEIHDLADLSAADLSSVGNTWNPLDSDPAMGVIGNVDADATGKGYFERTLGGASVTGDFIVVGHSIIVHAGPADASKPNPRIAGGVIERREQ